MKRYTPLVGLMIAGLLIVTAVSLGALYRYTHPSTPELPHPPLKDLAAQHDIQLGNFAILSRIDEKPYSDILSSQFHFVLADNTPNWYFTDGGLRPSPTTYNFKQMDEVMTYAKVHDMPVQAHHYLWGEEKWLPEWLKTGDYDKQELFALIEDHIKTVGGKYQGQIREWTVVNEAFSRGQGIYGLRDWWGDATGGKEYIDHAFIIARQADPSSVLILNDFQNEYKGSISDEMYTYIKDAKARDIPIDGLGMQMHIDGANPPTKQQVIDNMKRFGDLGVQVYVTELDVNMNDASGNSDEKNAKQAKIYHDMTRACIESGVCPSFALLGITDRETWYNYMGLRDPRPLPFDEWYRPKPAFYAMRDALEQQ